ncbi:MAG: DUF5320 domain-containing protein [Dehalococcoidia bacterium]|jgi:hypothetical protein
MPFGDGTGPRGMGPMTGWGAGYCAGSGGRGFNIPAFGRGGSGFNRGLGREMGRGGGRGVFRRGFNRFAAYPRW